MGGLGVVQSPQSVILHVQILLTSFDTSTTIDQRKLHTTYNKFYWSFSLSTKIVSNSWYPQKKKKKNRNLYVRIACKNCIKKIKIKKLKINEGQQIKNKNKKQTMPPPVNPC